MTEFTDEDGRVIQVGQCEDISHVFLRITEEDATAEACVTGEQVPAFAAALYEMAGLPSPLADIAEAEPDPGDARELAEAISAEMARRDRGLSGVYLVAAEVALRWMQSKQQRGEGDRRD